MVIWTNSAFEDLRVILNTSKAVHKKSYVKQIVSFAEVLNSMPLIGVKLNSKYNFLFKYKQDFYQIIYKNHRIIYYIQNNNIYILFVMHFKQDLFIKFIKYLQN